MKNLCIFIGNLGKSPEIQTLSSGDKVAKFSLATTESWKDKNGDKQTKTTWINCEVWGKQADTVEKYLEKGSKLYVESKLRIDEIEKDGTKKQFYKFIVNNFVMLDSKKDSESPAGHSSMNQPSQGSSAFDDDGDGDLPF